MTKKKEESEIIEGEAIEIEVIEEMPVEIVEEAGEILSVSEGEPEIKILQKIKDLVNLRGGK